MCKSPAAWLHSSGGSVASHEKQKGEGVKSRRAQHRPGGAADERADRVVGLHAQTRALEWPARLELELGAAVGQHAVAHAHHRARARLRAHHVERETQRLTRLAGSVARHALVLTCTR